MLCPCADQESTKNDQFRGHTPPIPDQAFFEKPVLQRQVGNQLFHVAHLATQVPDLAGVRLARRVPGQALLACFEKLLRPTVIQALRDPFAPAQRSDAVLAT